MLAIRKKAGVTQSEVAEAADLSDRTYADIERGTVNSLPSTTHNPRNIDKNEQKWYNRSARKKAENSKKACTCGGAYV